jgi:hypothetical protein
MTRWAVILGLLAVAGLAVVLAADDTTGDAIGIGLVGLACVGAVSLVFLWIGRSEDRDRERRPRG